MLQTPLEKPMVFSFISSSVQIKIKSPAKTGLL